MVSSHQKLPVDKCHYSNQEIISEYSEQSTLMNNSEKPKRFNECLETL